MNFKSVLGKLVSISFLAVLFANAVPGQTEKPSEENQTLRTLLSEVRQLRRTMQTNGLNAYRGQIILERIRLANEQVERMAQKLEDARNEVEKIEQTIPRFEDQTKVMETAIQQETDIARRAKLEFEFKDKKQQVERYKMLLSRGREREQQLSTELRATQARLTELESRLDLLEREIENEIERVRSEKKQPN
jgi:predicted  nucleic acid-binding Zn-ribbon protein